MTQPDVNDDVRFADNPSASQYEIYVGDRLAGFITYRLAPPTIELVHTEIKDEFEHHGLGGRIARAALDDARARGLRVIATCAYIKKFIAQHPEYRDLRV